MLLLNNNSVFFTMEEPGKRAQGWRNNPAAVSDPFYSYHAFFRFKLSDEIEQVQAMRYKARAAFVWLIRIYNLFFRVTYLRQNVCSLTTFSAPLGACGLFFNHGSIRIVVP